MRIINTILYPKIYWWFLLLLPFVFFGFYPSYFSKLLDGLPPVMHLHAFFMTLWVMIAIVQPFLVRNNKLKAHRLIGRFSYFIMPVVILSAYLIIRHRYYEVARQETEPQAADFIIIGVVYMFWLAIFYSLAIINRRKMVAHATYMFAAILTLLGPTIDRILFQVCQRFGWEFNLFAESFVFAVIFLLLAGLFWYQRKKGISTRPVTTALIIYSVGQVLYFTLPGTTAWHWFMRMFM